MLTRSMLIAVAVATAWYQELGYTVEDVGSRKSWERNRQILWIAGESMITRRPW